MIEQELKNIWQAGGRSEEIRLELTRLVLELQQNMADTERRVKARNVAETAAAIGGMGLFGYFAWAIPFPLTQIACLIAIAWFAYVIYRLQRAAQLASPGAATSFRDQLERQQQYLQKQARLLDTVLYWYILPPFVTNVLFVFGLGDPAAANWDPGWLQWLPFAGWEKVVYLLLIAVFFGYVVWLNRRAVRKEFRPLIAQVMETRRQLDLLG